MRSTDVGVSTDYTGITAENDATFSTRLRAGHGRPKRQEGGKRHRRVIMALTVNTNVSSLTAQRSEIPSLAFRTAWFIFFRCL